MGARPAGAALLKQALYHSGLLRLARMARQRVRGVVLRYHALTEGPAPVLYAAPDICLPVELFRLQMAFAKRAYSVVSLVELVDALEQGTRLPRRALAVTFDDGYADNHVLGLPVLRALHLPATVYVATGSVAGGAPFWVGAVRALVLSARGSTLAMPDGTAIALEGDRAGAVKELTRALVPMAASQRAELLARVAEDAGVDLHGVLAKTMLTWEQIRELHAAGWVIGAHTVTHSNVALIAPEEAEREMLGSRDALAAAIGGPVQHFCYPNTGGRHQYFSHDTGALLRRLGFRSATTSRPGALHPDVDRFALPRLGVSPRLGPVSALAVALERQRLAA
jgi:peptidoglycan/xylan/chitin deacetylase (PgdA/CDA1 family)